MKRIVLCTDGTWNKPDQEDKGKRKPSNVVKIARAVVPRADDGVHQIVYYDQGVGTNWGLDKIAGGGMGIGLSANIVEAYRFLVLNYEPGDEIYVFGFSRGAYTARSLSGFIQRLGVLPKDHAFYISDAYALYQRQVSEDLCQEFSGKHNCRTTTIKFMGVWDTVGALGIPLLLFRWFNRRYRFHDVNLHRCIEHAYHALSIDERRRPFLPSLWSLPEGSSQTLEQTWFAGVHTNVGGGYAKDGLANITLHWMKKRAMNHGLVLNKEFLKPYRPVHTGDLRNSMSFMYRVMVPTSRKIGVSPRANETVHSSAMRRLEEMESYKPKNLIEYRKRTQSVGK